MRRLQLIEIHEQPWCPASVRDGVTDFLQFATSRRDLFFHVAPLLARALTQSGTRQIVDLCAGAGGPWPRLLPQVQRQIDGELEVLLTDLYPNATAGARLETPGLRFIPTSVDATRVPGELCGFRTLFHAFHHFPPERARKILQDAVDQGQGIAVFEATERRPLTLLLQVLVPLFVLLDVGRIRPFRWSRLAWTFPLPVLPLVAFLDGVVSCLRSYSTGELEQLVATLDDPGYHWEIGRVQVPIYPARVTYLMGWPAARSDFSRGCQA